MASQVNEIGEEYIRLAFQVEYFLKAQIGDDTIVVDSYFGPPEFKPTKQTVDPDSLLNSIQKATDPAPCLFSELLQSCKNPADR